MGSRSSKQTSPKSQANNNNTSDTTDPDKADTHQKEVQQNKQQPATPQQNKEPITPTKHKAIRNKMAELESTGSKQPVSWMMKDMTELIQDLQIANPKDSKWWDVVDGLIDKKETKIIPQTQRKGWKTVRLFISSTFKDMNNEREYLVKTIIPVLRQWCEERRIRLIECDLRWGVPKDSDTRETLMACLSEIDRCREENELPYFLCMLSERYGYVSDPDDVPIDIKTRYKWLPGMSVTALEIFTAAYWDRNKHALYMLRDPGFLADVKDKSILTGYVETKEESVESLKVLKGKLQEHYRDQIRDYKVQLTGEAYGQLKLTGFEYFGKEIIKHFKAQIDEQYPTTSLGEELTDVEIQKAQQTDFLVQRAHYLLGRDDALETMHDYMDTEHTNPGLLLLVGHPGAGKSSLMAYSAKQALSNQSYKVFYHFVGATPDSTDPYSILSRFYRECLPDDGNMPVDLDEMLRYAPTMFKKAAETAKENGYERLIIYLDALNQMDEEGTTAKLTWLPREFSPQTRMIVSTLAGSCLDALRSHQIKPEEIAVEPLNLEIRRDIVAKILFEYNKQLDQEQMSFLIAKCDAGRPLWLSIACEDLRVYGDFKTLTDKIQNIPGDLAGLTEIVLVRIIEEYGKDLVEAALCLLETSRFGLMESELLELLALQPVTYNAKQTCDHSDNGKVLMAQWAFVYLGLKPFLRPFGGSGEGRLDFYHRSTSKVVRSVYLKKPEVKQWWHQRLSAYFHRCKDSTRAAEELPFHLQQLGDRESMTKCLASPDIFLQLYQEKTKQQLMKYWVYAGGYDIAATSYMKSLKQNMPANMDESSLIRLKSQIGWFMVDMGEYDKAEQFLKKFLEELEKKFGGSGKQLCEPFHALLTLYYRAALKFVYGSSDGYVKYTNLGKTISSKCVKAYEANYDKTDIKLGEVYSLAGYFKPDYLKNAMKLFQSSDSKHQSGLAQVYYMLGEQNQYHEDMDVPKNYFKKSLSLCLSNYGRFHLHTARCVQLYGQLFWNRWVYVKRRELLEGCIEHYISEVEILEEILGVHHPNVVRSREDVIIVLENLCRTNEAEKYRRLQPAHNESV